MVPIGKGGPFSRFYADVHLGGPMGTKWARFERLRWSPPPTVAQARVRPSLLSAGPDLVPQDARWPSLRVMPRGCIFADKGPTAFVSGDGPADCYSRCLSIANSRPFRALVDLQMAFGSYEVGVIQRTPVPDLTPADEAALASLARRAWSLKRSLDTRTETTHAFVLPALLQVPGDTLAARAAAWAARVRATEDELAAIQAEIDERCFALYGISDEDRRSITEGFGGSRPARGRGRRRCRCRRRGGGRGRHGGHRDPRRRARVLGGRGRLRPLRRPPRHRGARAPG